MTDLPKELAESLKNPSDASWQKLVAALEKSAALLDRVRDGLRSWPLDLQRTPPARWVVEEREELLALCWAPGGILVDLFSGGGGLGELSRQEVAAPERLAEACVFLVAEALQEHGDVEAIGWLTGVAFSHGQAVREHDLLPHVIASAFGESFPLSEIPEGVAAQLREASVALADRDYDLHTDGPRVPVKLRFDPDGLDWPDVASTPGWWSREADVIIYSDASPMYHVEVADLAAGFHRFAPNEDEPLLAPDRPAAPVDGAATIERMVAATGFGAKLHDLLALMERFGIWERRGSLDDAVDEAAEVVGATDDHLWAARRIVGVLAERGGIEGPGVPMVLGLMSAHEHDLEPFRKQLGALVASEALLLTDSGDTEALVPLYVWASSNHPDASEASAALAEVLIDHPHVEDVFCSDEALLAPPT